MNSISNYFNTYVAIFILFQINVRNTINEAIAWWQSNTKQHSHLIDGLLLLSFVSHFLSLISLIKVYHHHFLQQLKRHIFWYLHYERKYCLGIIIVAATAVISRRVFLWKISQSIGGTVNTLRNDTPLMWKPWYLQKMIRIKLAWRNLQFISNVLLYIHFLFCFNQSMLIGHINHL